MNLQVVVRQGFAKRIFQAHSQLEAREGKRITRDEIAGRIKKLVKGATLDQSTVASWFNRGVVPLPELGIVVANVYGVRGGWLYFNEPPVSDREADLENYATADDASHAWETIEDRDKRVAARNAALKKKRA